MANEISINAQVAVRMGNLQYQSNPGQFKANLSVANGPSPGAVTATTGGVNVSLAQLTLPGMLRITNTDSTNYVTFGLYEISGTIFRPFGELLPGETAILRLSRSVLTANTAADVIRLVAHTASCVVQFDCFDT